MDLAPKEKRKLGDLAAAINEGNRLGGFSNDDGNGRSPPPELEPAREEPEWEVGAGGTVVSLEYTDSGERG